MSNIEIDEMLAMDLIPFEAFCENISQGATEIAEQLYAQMMRWTE